jgi:chromosome transmission fidelity protein 18
MKEADTNYLGVLTDLFCPMSKKRVKDRGLCEADENKYVERLSHALQATGMLDRIALGCFEHYANLHRHDATFARYIKANEWLVAYDVLSGAMRSEREYGVLQYLSYTLVPFFPLFQERGGPRVERPKADWEVSSPTSTLVLVEPGLTYSVVVCQDTCKRGDIQIARARGAYSQRALSWALP